MSAAYSFAPPHPPSPWLRCCFTPLRSSVKGSCISPDSALILPGREGAEDGFGGEGNTYDRQDPTRPCSHAPRPAPRASCAQLSLCSSRSTQAFICAPDLLKPQAAHAWQRHDWNVWPCAAAVCWAPAGGPGLQSATCWQDSLSLLKMPASLMQKLSCHPSLCCFCLGLSCILKRFAMS